MAIHQYKCKTCEIEFEFMKIRSDEVVECPKCGETEEKQLEQQISRGTSFSLKGKWYKEGY